MELLEAKASTMHVLKPIATAFPNVTADHLKKLGTKTIREDPWNAPQSTDDANKKKLKAIKNLWHLCW